MEYTTIQSKKEEIQNIREAFYQQSSKNIFFKKKQKFECAKSICEQMSLDDLLYHTAWIIPNTHSVYIDYTVLKLYANPTNFDLIVDKCMGLALECSNNVPTFEVHMNLEGFTISACERYKTIIELFCHRCFVNNTRFSERMSAFHLYNVPAVVDHIHKIVMPIIPPEARNKFVLHKKSESMALLEALHHQNS